MTDQPLDEKGLDAAIRGLVWAGCNPAPAEAVSAIAIRAYRAQAGQDGAGRVRELEDGARTIAVKAGSAAYNTKDWVHDPGIARAFAVLQELANALLPAWRRDKPVPPPIPTIKPVTDADLAGGEAEACRVAGREDG